MSMGIYKNIHQFFSAKKPLKKLISFLVKRSNLLLKPQTEKAYKNKQRKLKTETLGNQCKKIQFALNWFLRSLFNELFLRL